MAVIEADRDIAGGAVDRPVLDLRDVAARHVGKLSHRAHHLARCGGRQVLHLRPVLRVEEGEKGRHVGADIGGRAVGHAGNPSAAFASRSEEHTSELQSLMRISYAVFCLKKKTCNTKHKTPNLYNKI